MGKPLTRFSFRRTQIMKTAPALAHSNEIDRCAALAGICQFAKKPRTRLPRKQAR
jgi:hypothetical protein